MPTTSLAILSPWFCEERGFHHHQTLPRSTEGNQVWKRTSQSLIHQSDSPLFLFLTIPQSAPPNNSHAQTNKQTNKSTNTQTNKQPNRWAYLFPPAARGKVNNNNNNKHKTNTKNKNKIKIKTKLTMKVTIKKRINITNINNNNSSKNK